MSVTVDCFWCFDRKRIQVTKSRVERCQVCDPGPVQAQLIPPPFKFKRLVALERAGQIASRRLW